MPAAKKYPSKYPEDLTLRIEAETISDAGYAHEIGRALGVYSASIWLYNNTRANRNNKGWVECVRCERVLRGIISEARSGRFQERAKALKECE